MTHGTVSGGAGFGDTNLGGCVEEARDLVAGGILEHHLVEE